MSETKQLTITRETIDALLDDHQIEALVVRRQPPGKDSWWAVRRNGKTWRGARDPHRIRIPVKAGIKLYDTITEADFGPDGVLDPTKYRVKKTDRV